MIKSIVAIFWGGLFCVPALAQTRDTAIGMVRYSFSHLRDTTKPAEFYKENMVLFIGSQVNVYQSYDRIQAKLEIKKQVEARRQMTETERRITPIIAPPDMKMGSNVFYYKNLSAKSVQNVEDFYGNIYYIDDDLPAIDWQIGSDTKEISGLVCQKATTVFKGRNYEAWFCSNFPYRDGPWKFNGLPGLIIEVADTKRQVVFQFAGFENITNQRLPIELPKQAVKTAVKDLNRIRETVEKNIAAMMAGNGNASGSLKAQSGGSPAPEQKIVINNPIELDK